jgi:hypothetical protein
MSQLTPGALIGVSAAVIKDGYGVIPHFFTIMINMMPELIKVVFGS